MTIDRAIEILDPEHREHYDGMYEVNEACRMGMEALERTRWIPCSERLPESDEVWQKYVVVYRYRYRDIWDDMGENVVVTPRAEGLEHGRRRGYKRSDRQ